MAESASSSREIKPRWADGFDVLTVMCVGAATYVVATSLHEHLGHAVAGLLLGGRVAEYGAFYVNYVPGSLSQTGMRLGALAGPVVSLVLGLVGAAVVNRMRSGWGRYIVWLLASLGFMVAFGYLLFSAVTGLGDLGFDKDGLLFGAPFQIGLRIVMFVAGVVSYMVSVWWIFRAAEKVLGGGPTQRQRIVRIAMLTWIAGCAVSVFIGLFSPYGLFILLISAAPASLGGTSGFLWGPYFARVGRRDDQAASEAPPVVLARNWALIAVSLIMIVVYAVVLGPTIYAT